MKEKIKVGDIVEFNNLSLIEDLDLADWLSQFNKTKYEVVEVDEESKLFWIKDCEYAISFDEHFKKSQLEYVYIVTTCSTNIDEDTETQNRIIKVTRHIGLAESEVQILVEEIEENYTENGFVFNEEESQNDTQKTISITRGDFLETIVISIIRMEVD